MLKEWEQQPEETKAAYLAFRQYLQLGTERTIVAAYRAHRRKPNAKQATGTWNLWVDRWKWQRRAVAYDREQERIEEQARLKAADAEAKLWARRTREHRERMARVGQLLVEKGEQMLGYPLSRQKVVGADGKTTIVEPAKWGFRDSATLVDTGNKLLQLATGGLTDHVKVETDEPEQLAARAIEIARAAFADLRAELKAQYADMPDELISERAAYHLSKKYNIDPSVLMTSEERVN